MPSVKKVKDHIKKVHEKKGHGLEQQDHLLLRIQKLEEEVKRRKVLKETLLSENLRLSSKLDFSRIYPHRTVPPATRQAIEEVLLENV